MATTLDFNPLIDFFQEIEVCDQLKIMERNQQNLPPPPDGGWGWIVAIGAFLVQMQVASISITFGVYFAHIRATQ